MPDFLGLNFRRQTEINENLIVRPHILSGIDFRLLPFFSPPDLSIIALFFQHCLLYPVLIWDPVPEGKLEQWPLIG
jgi:hypothetical protein